MKHGVYHSVSIDSDLTMSSLLGASVSLALSGRPFTLQLSPVKHGCHSEATYRAAGPTASKRLQGGHGILGDRLLLTDYDQ